MDAETKADASAYLGALVDLEPVQNCLSVSQFFS